MTKHHRSQRAALAGRRVVLFCRLGVSRAGQTVCGTTHAGWNVPAGDPVFVSGPGPIYAVLSAVGEYRSHSMLSQRPRRLGDARDLGHASDQQRHEPVLHPVLQQLRLGVLEPDQPELPLQLDAGPRDREPGRHLHVPLQRRHRQPSSATQRGSAPTRRRHRAAGRDRRSSNISFGGTGHELGGLVVGQRTRAISGDWPASTSGAARYNGSAGPLRLVPVHERAEHPAGRAGHEHRRRVLDRRSRSGSTTRCTARRATPATSSRARTRNLSSGRPTRSTTACRASAAPPPAGGRASARSSPTSAGARSASASGTTSGVCAPAADQMVNCFAAQQLRQHEQPGRLRRYNQEHGTAVDHLAQAHAAVGISPDDIGCWNGNGTGAPARHWLERLGLGRQPDGAVEQRAATTTAAGTEGLSAERRRSRGWPRGEESATAPERQRPSIWDSRTRVLGARAGRLRGRARSLGPPQERAGPGAASSASAAEPRRHCRTSGSGAPIRPCSAWRSRARRRRRLRARAPDPPPVIDEVVLEKKEVCAGEENLVTVKSHTDQRDRPVPAHRHRRPHGQLGARSRSGRDDQRQRRGAHRSPCSGATTWPRRCRCPSTR